MTLSGNRLRRLVSARTTRWLPAALGSPWLRVLGGSAALGALLFAGSLELRVSGDFQVLPIQRADLRAQVEGMVEEISVDEGSFVQRGDVIARLVDRDLRAALRKNEAEIAERVARLRMLLAGPRPEEIHVARAALGKARERLRYAESVVTTSTSLFEDPRRGGGPRPSRSSARPRPAPRSRKSSSESSSGPGGEGLRRRIRPRPERV